MSKIKKDTAERLLMHLKMKGALPLVRLASELGITKEGARQHLLKLIADDLIISFHKSEGVGRPTAYYHLTDKGFSKFPDTHAQVTVELLQSVKNLLGENALDLLISEREKMTFNRYTENLLPAQHVEERLNILTRLRTQEGYMAEWKKEGNAYFLIENHCPICAAATECQGFCRAELANFKQLIGGEFSVERTEHLITNGRRCVYRIEGKQ